MKRIASGGRAALFFVTSLAVAILLWAGPSWAEERESEEARGPALAPASRNVALAGAAGRTWLDMGLGLIGLPGTAGSPEDESVYEKARQMRGGFESGGLNYGERYRRNPDGSYGGAGSAARWSGGDNVADRLLEQALSAGGGWFSSWAEGWLGGYGRARISVRLDDEGDVTGSGDFLLPLYDSEGMALFTQLGLRTMTGDRVIGNFGLGQRFFPATNFAFGYNAFLDQDFSRRHTRGGAGIEAWYDWLRLSANYYTPLSGWKDSKDYDGNFVEERPAEGYDARLTGYLPFYRNLAVNGAFEQWKGERVGAFGRGDGLDEDPKVWSYGLEWTPVPAFAVSVDQRHSGDQKETQFGLTFNYYFGMEWEDQLSSAAVAEMRTVDGSRHEFVNRQNEMILEYRAKEGVFNIIPRGTAGTNVFVFQFTNGFSENVVGHKVAVSLPAGVVDSGHGVYTTDGDGLISIALLTVPASAAPATATLTVGRTSQTFRLEATETAVAGAKGLTFTAANENENFVTSTNNGYQSTITVTLTQYNDGSGPKSLPAGATVSWDVTNVVNPNAVWWKRDVSARHGLSWDSTTGSRNPTWPSMVPGNRPTGSVAELTDVVGSRTVTLTASVCIDGTGAETTEPICNNNGGTWYTGDKAVTFGAGPLSVFTTDPSAGVGIKWATQAGAKDTTGATTLDTTGANGDFADTTNTFPAAALVGGTVPSRVGVTYSGASNSWAAALPVPAWGAQTTSFGSNVGARYATGSNLPTGAQLLAVAGYSATYDSNVQRKGAAKAAGWPLTSDYWTGEVLLNNSNGIFIARVVGLNSGTSSTAQNVNDGRYVAVGVGSN